MSDFTEYAAAFDKGFSKLDMTDPCCAVARMALEIHALNGAPDRNIAAFANFMAFSYWSKDITHVTKLLAELDTLPTGAARLGEIGTLLRLFADFTHTHPEGVTMENWRQELRINGQLLEDWAQDRDNDLQGRDARSKAACAFLSARFTNLWS